MKTSKGLWQQEELLKIYENTKEWEKALEIKAEIDKWKGTPDNSQMALYCLESGRALMASDGHGARLKFKEAIKRAPKLPWPYILIADTYFKENRVEDALEFWSRLFDELPSKAYLIFDKIEKYFYESGAYGEVGRIYRELVEREPENLDALLALSGYLFKRGDREEAASCCRRALEINPNSREAYAELLRQTLDRTECDEEIQALIREMLKMYPARKRFMCRVCMHRTEIPYWRCNACGAWNPYEV
jgi:lipopolysaccharide biosynthesis regulator YciM